MVKSRTLDDKCRVKFPPGFRPGQQVVFEKLDDYTWLVKRPRPKSEVKMVAIRVIDSLPDDPEWDKLEKAFATAATREVPPFEE